jgi:GntR family transcriptional regulator / MocR family aminotransferase
VKVTLRVARGARGAGLSLQEQLYRQLCGQIDAGALPPGTRLPASRSLAASVGVARNTVEAVLGRLQREGRLRRRVGAWTEVVG